MLNLSLGFKLQTLLLSRMFYFVESGKISEPVYTPEQAQAGTTNRQFLTEFIGNLLQSAFPNLQPYVLPLQMTPTQLLVILTPSSAQISNFIEGLFTLSSDLGRFKLNIRDFLIQLKEFSGDNTELYAEDRETAQQAAKEAERERAAKVGGLLKPSEIDQDDEL